mmetsp:Transcript_4032/g.6206  ORF Transcript_4032/g.6206 Transcript_4032/m.6206 type:complete len:290 (+) Transcript_4032:1139-2008(+)
MNFCGPKKFWISNAGSGGFCCRNLMICLTTFSADATAPSNQPWTTGCAVLSPHRNRPVCEYVSEVTDLPACQKWWADSHRNRSHRRTETPEPKVCAIWLFTYLVRFPERCRDTSRFASVPDALATQKVEPLRCSNHRKGEGRTYFAFSNAAAFWVLAKTRCAVTATTVTGRGLANSGSRSVPTNTENLVCVRGAANTTAEALSTLPDAKATEKPVSTATFTSVTLAFTDTEQRLQWSWRSAGTVSNLRTSSAALFRYTGSPLWEHRSIAAICFSAARVSAFWTRCSRGP